MPAAPHDPVYLDYNATAPMRPQSIAAVEQAMRAVGNPSSIHGAGRANRALVENARAAVAALVNASREDIVFTSGGSEANALAIESAVEIGARRIVVGAIEHDCVLATAEASKAQVDVWPVSSAGIVDLGWLRDRVAGRRASDGPLFVALMMANNETGAIQPVAETARIVHAAGGWLHVDAVQAAGKIPIDVVALGADTLAISGHKIGGPTGIGALVARGTAILTPRQRGGGQERGRRAGTENLLGIAGFGAAATVSQMELPQVALQAPWRDRAIERLRRDADVVVMSEGAPRLPTTLCFAARNFSSEQQLIEMDFADIMVSAGAACSSGNLRGSRVVREMGFAEWASSTLRVSGGWASTEQDWQRFCDAWLDAWRRRKQVLARAAVSSRSVTSSG